MTHPQHKILELLALCEKGKGMIFDKGSAARTISTPLVRKGLVEWIEGGGIRVYSITDAGRQALFAGATP